MNCRTFSQNPRTRGKGHYHHQIKQGEGARHAEVDDRFNVYAAENALVSALSSSDSLTNSHESNRNKELEFLLIQSAGWCYILLTTSEGDNNRK